MQVTESIVQYIEEHLKGPDACVQFRRNELAALLGCAPSQITYVIASHYTVGRGYLVESRRGGGGFVRITRTQMPLKAMETQQEKSLSFASAQLFGAGIPAAAYFGAANRCCHSGGDFGSGAQPGAG